MLARSGQGRAERSSAYRALIDEDLIDALLADIHVRRQQQRALGYNAIRALVDAKTFRFAGIRPAHGATQTTTVTDK